MIPQELSRALGLDGHAEKEQGGIVEVSHIVVATLTGLSVALLVWVEIRSRRNRAGQPQDPVSVGPQENRIK
jgi:hypothetical protein